jgi:DUF4097 and DUF4098 domain-containing protein YvlB
MEIPMKRVLLALFLAASTPLVLADSIDKVNGSIRVEAGQDIDDVETVNGSIRLDDDAKAEDISTVNGGVTLGRRAQARSIENVNGSITLREGAKVARGVDSVNAAITLEKGADVGGKVDNVNGAIELEEAHVGGGIGTVAGNIEIGANSRVENGIHVEKPHGDWSVHFGKKKVPRIVIGPNAVVQGALVFDREVELYVSDRATIGQVQGATAVKFPGDHP